MPRILLTNDDGVDAPALIPFARALHQIGSVSVVAPAGERSWVGKAITRHDPLTVQMTRRTGMEIAAVDGYPADCAQIGMHADPASTPDLVVSGINVGYNHGSAFLMSSGTVGAAFEASLGGVPAVAVSAGIIGDWPRWSAHAWSAASRPMWERLADVATDLISILVRHGFPGGVDVVTINLPEDATRATERRVTRLATTAYDQLFAAQRDGTYRHAVANHRVEGDAEGTDVQAARDGVVSITPLCLPATGSLPEELVAGLVGRKDSPEEVD